MKLKVSWRVLLTVLVGGAAYIFIFYQLFHKTNFWQFREILEKASFYWLVVGLAVSFLMIFLQGYFLKRVFDLYNLKISLKDAIITWLITIPTGLVTFGMSGTAIIFYQAKKRGASNQLATIIVATYFGLYILANVLFMLAIGGPFIISLAEVNIFYVLLMVGAAAIFSYFIVTKRGRELFFGFGEKYLPRIFGRIEKKELLSLEEKKVFSVLLSAMSTICANLIIFATACFLFKLDIGFLEVIKSFIVAGLVSIFSPSGGGVGFVELATAGYLQYLGVKAGQSGMIVIAYRLFNYWLPVVLGLVFLSLKSYKTLLKMSAVRG